MNAEPTEETVRWRHVLGPAGGRRSPLRVVAHIDLDAFYAQVEAKRLHVPASEPLAVQQWQSLIAVNYAARAFGVTRHESAVEARKRCPQLRLAHVATWAEGDDSARYHDKPDVARHKVSLEPYRRESRRIMALLRDAFASHGSIVEKASVDESFIDLSGAVRARLVEQYGLQAPPPPFDMNEPLGPPPQFAWQAEDGFVCGESPHITWHDVALKIGAEMVAAARARVLEQLGFTCSAGVARNKLLAKLASGRHKPNMQTIVRDEAAAAFVAGFELTKIRMLGGKLGDAVTRAYATNSVEEMRRVELPQLQQTLGSETGQWMYDTLRGRDFSPVTSRTLIKSMQSAKNFRPSINTMAQAEGWLRVLLADIAARLDEAHEDDAASGAVARRPRTLGVHYRSGAVSRGRQCGIPPGRDLTLDVLVGLGSGLLRQMQGEGSVMFPCHALSASVAGFRDVGEGDSTRGIAHFFPQAKRGRDGEEEGTMCEECGKWVEADGMQEHGDYHYARNLLQQEREESLASRRGPDPGIPRMDGKQAAKRDDSKGAAVLAATRKTYTSSKGPSIMSLFAKAQASAGAKRTRRPPPAPAPTQLQLDMVSTQTECSECGMAFMRGVADDEAMHRRFHAEACRGVELPRGHRGVSGLTVVWDGGIDTIVACDASHPEAAAALRLANAELGASMPALDSAASAFKAFLYTKDGARRAGAAVVGVLLVERITAAHDTATARLSTRHVLGVSRVWVAAGERRRGVASRMLDAACSHYLPGCRLSRGEVAFSQPSESGLAWAAKWLGEMPLAVYDYGMMGREEEGGGGASRGEKG